LEENNIRDLFMYEKIKGKTVILRLLGLKYENIGFTIH